MTTGSFTEVKPLDILATLREAKEALEKPMHIYGSASWYCDALNNLDSLIEQIEKAEPVALVVASEFGSIPKFLANGKDHPKVGTLLYLHPAAPTIPENIDEIAVELWDQLYVTGFKSQIYARRLAARILGEKK